jgi:glycerol kinase
VTTQYLLAIDQGTSSSRTVIYDERANAVASAQQEFRQIYPKSGWVEHDPEEIWTSVRNTLQEALEKAGITMRDVAGIGITNQRETTLVWDRRSGECIYNAIVWQDRRTAAFCRELSERCADDIIAGKTGLRLDPYFSATKAAWILDNV